MQDVFSRVDAWGADRRPKDRPGVPRETDPPAPVSSAPWLALEQQVAGPVAALGPLRHVTPVYATTNPPRGVSGIVRRAAYRIPDYKPSRWLLLMLADRIDVFEQRAAPVTALLGGVVVVVGAALAFKRIREA